MIPTRPGPHSALILPIALLAMAGISAPRAEILDQAKVHYDYSNGEFDNVEKDLEAFQARNRTYRREDSIFIAKHLAVVYAADPKTREKGRYYMFRLLELVPGVKLVDMFVSEEIDRIFEKVREEFDAKAIAMGRAPYRPAPAEGIRPAAGQAPASERPPRKPAKKEEDPSSAKYWVAGGAGLMAVGAASAYIFLRRETPKDEVYVVDKGN